VRGRPRTIPIARGGAFLSVLRGDVAPRDLPLTVTYRDGSTRVFGVDAGRIAR
jgi:hypothetical protein